MFDISSARSVVHALILSQFVHSCVTSQTGKAAPLASSAQKRGESYACGSAESTHRSTARCRPCTSSSAAVRSGVFLQGRPYHSQVIQAMINVDFDVGLVERVLLRMDVLANLLDAVELVVYVQRCKVARAVGYLHGGLVDRIEILFGNDNVRV